jgi:tetratricopeptide (TPR) repeat protein
MGKWGLIVLAIATGLLVLVGAISLGTFFLFRQQPFDVPGWQDPITLVNVDSIDPALAVAGLGGVSDGDLVAQALTQARADTAFAILVFSPSIGDQESAGDFLLLANRYRSDNQPEQAVVCYRLAGTIATLSPDLPDTVRADTFVLAGEGLADLGEFGLAQLYFDQAYNIAIVSPYLQAATRRNIFQRLHQGYQAIGDRERARVSLEQSAEAFPAVTVIESSPFGYSAPVLPVAEGPRQPAGTPLSLEVQQAEAARWEAAQALAALLIERGGRAPAGFVATLGGTLTAEDEVKLPYFDSQLAATPQLSVQISIVQARINWLAVKYRVARGGYGISLVPEWEAQAEAIRADLTKSYELLFALYADLIVAMPDADQIDLATEEILRREILAGTLGRYPNYPAEQRIAQLLQATAHLAESRPGEDMRVVVLPYAGVDSFVLVDDAGFWAATQHPSGTSLP